MATPTENMQIHLQTPKSYYGAFNDCRPLPKTQLASSKPKNPLFIRVLGSVTWHAKPGLLNEEFQSLTTSTAGVPVLGERPPAP